MVARASLDSMVSDLHSRLEAILSAVAYVSCSEDTARPATNSCQEEARLEVKLQHRYLGSKRSI